MYAVGKGSANRPYMVNLTYRGNKENPDDIIAIIGKGVTYDCGGLSIKMALMEKMYGDKGGACSIFGIF